MASVAVAPANISGKAGKPGLEEVTESKRFRIRITLSSTKVQALEQTCRDLIERAARTKSPTLVKGPVRLPTKILRITTRKSPCGEGSKTWDRLEMRIHKRLIDLTSSMEDMQEIISAKVEAGVDVEVTIADQQ